MSQSCREGRVSGNPSLDEPDGLGYRCPMRHPVGFLHLSHEAPHDIWNWSNEDKRSLMKDAWFMLYQDMMVQHSCYRI